MLRVDGGRQRAQVEQLHGQGAVGQATIGDNPLEGHTAAVGQRGPSIGDRFKSFFSAVGRSIVAFGSAIGRGLASIPAAIGEAFAARRRNAAQAQGPGHVAAQAPPNPLAAARDAALGDPDLARIESSGIGMQQNVKPEILTPFLARHLDALASPAFWDHQYTKMNAEHLGCGLALAAVDRMVAKGRIDEADRELFERMASGNGVGPRPQMPDEFLGPVTDQAKDWMAQRMFENFGRPEAPLPLNMDGGTATGLRDGVSAEGATADDKLAALRDTYSTVMGNQYIGHNNLRSPLQAIPD